MSSEMVTVDVVGRRDRASVSYCVLYCSMKTDAAVQYDT